MVCGASGERCEAVESGRGMNELALFAGAGGGILGGKLLGWRTVCAVERDSYAASVLVARQNDGILAPFPIWDDVRTFDGKPWRGCVDVVSGGFPCQDISSAGKGAGIEGAKSGLWKEMARIVGEVRPRYVLVENSPMLIHRGLAVVLGDLASMGYDAHWGVLGADDAGACHKRKRLWLIAADSYRKSEHAGAVNAEVAGSSSSLAHSDMRQCEQPNKEVCTGWHSASNGGWWSSEPDVGRMADGVASRVDRLRAIGNGQVPAVVQLAWKLIGPPPL